MPPVGPFSSHALQPKGVLFEQPSLNEYREALDREACTEVTLPSCAPPAAVPAAPPAAVPAAGHTAYARPVTLAVTAAGGALLHVSVSFD